MKNYHKILGINNDASDEEVKKAFRDLAKQYHPDVNKEMGAEDKFKEINEAYDHIINKKIDPEPMRRGPFHGGPIDMDINDIHKYFNMQRTQRRFIEEDIHIAMGISFMESCLGVDKQITFSHLVECKTCKEYKSKNGNYNVKKCPVCDGRGQEIRHKNNFVISTPCRACAGEGSKLECAECNGIGAVNEEKTVGLKIPEGIRHENVLRVFGFGNYNYEKESYGNVMVHIQVYNDTKFNRDEDNIFSELELNYLDCLLGGEFEISTIFGQAIIKVPECTSNGTILKMNNHGVKHIGHQYVTVKVTMPKYLDKKTRKVLTNLKKYSKV